MSDTSLAILTKDQDGEWASRETFTPSTVREIKRPGPIWDKALLGFGIGFVIGAVATWRV